MTRTEKRATARNLYLAYTPIERIAAILKVSPRTVWGYKQDDQKEGLRWDSLRHSQLLKGHQSEKQNLYEHFTKRLDTAIENIEGNEALGDLEKVQAITKLADAFAKMNTVLRQKDPDAYRLGIISEVLKVVTEAFSHKLDKEGFLKVLKILDSEAVQLELKQIHF